MSDSKVSEKKNKSGTTDMTTGNIIRHMVMFCMPLMLGNLFQMLYNTVDMLVVGNFVGKEALAAVGSTTPIVNIVIFFFNGVSIGAGVVISRYFGAKEEDNLHLAVETTMALTFIISIGFMIGGTYGVPFMLRMMATPEDVMGPASLYLRIYFAGVMGLLVYNMGSGILRAVGDTKRPLMFLIFTSLVNIVLDLFFVVVMRRGIDGVAYATILSQFASASMVLVLLCRTKEIYRFSFRDMRVDLSMTRQIMSIGFPAGIQSMITSFSNVFVQSYINSFGSSVMAGWSCYNKLDQFIFLPVMSMGQAATTFVSQNVGAKRYDRVVEGTRKAIVVGTSVTLVLAVIIWIVAGDAVRCFTADAEVVHYGKLFLRLNVFFMVSNGVNQIVAGSLRGRGDAKGPMFIMLGNFVLVRQLYLFIITRFVNDVRAVGLGYPVGWLCCCAMILLYNHHKEKVFRQKKTV